LILQREPRAIASGRSYSAKPKTDLKQRCYAFSLRIIALTDTLPNKRSAWVIVDQLIRSATSIGANLVEERASSSRLEFKKFNEIALKSANETKYWLCLLRDTGLADKEASEKLLIEAVEIAKMLASGVSKLKYKKF
jgi:four helix bundle protein